MSPNVVQPNKNSAYATFRNKAVQYAWLGSTFR